MALSYKARRRWSLIVLLVWMPAYIVGVVTLMNAIPRPPLVLEVIIYVVLGLICFLPFKFVFQGVGQKDPDDPSEEDREAEDR
ncbi:MAG: DUF2842 domain-containing protein [Pseudomonadota bacterium]